MTFKHLGIGLAGLLLIIVSGVVALATSETALRWAVNSAAQLIPGSLTINTVRGRLLGPITLGGIEYQNDEQRIASEVIRIQWQPLALLDARLHLNNVEIKTLRITKNSDAPQTPATGDTGDLSLPLAVRLDALSISDILYQGPEGQQIPIDRITLAARLEADRLDVNQFSLQAPQGSLRLNGHVDLVQRSIDIVTAWRVTAGEFEPFAGGGSISGSLARSTFKQTLTAPVSLSMTGTLYDLVQNPRWESRISFMQLNPRKLRKDLPELAIDSTIEAQGDLSQLRVDAAIQTRLEEFGKLEIETEISGGYTSPWNIDDLQLALPEHQARLQANGTLGINQGLVEYAFTTQWENLRWPLNQTPWLTSSRGTAQISGTGTEYRISSDARVETQQIGQASLKLSGAGNLQMFDLHNAQLGTALGNLRTQGAIRWVTDKPTENNALNYQLSGDWEDIVWPSSESPRVKSEAGTFRLHGVNDTYQLTLNGSIAGQDISSGKLTVTGQGNTQRFAASNLNLETAQGKIIANGSLDWHEGLSWQLSAQAQDVDPSLQWPEWPGKLNAQMQSKGSLKNQQLSTTLDMESLSGSLRGYPVTGSGNFTIDRDQYQVSSLSLTIGDSKVTASGRLDDRWQLEFNADAPDLAALSPQLQGLASASGKLSGPRKQPRLQLTLSASELAMNGMAVSSLNADLDVDVSDRLPSHIKLAISKGQYQKWSVDTLNLDASGTLASHAWRLDAANASEQVGLAAQGGYTQNRWQGTINELQVRTRLAGAWALDSPARASFAADQFSVDTACLVSDQGRACLEAGWKKDGRARLLADLQSVSSGLFAPLIPEGYTWQDTLSGKVIASLDEKRDIQLDSTIQLGPGYIALKEVDEELLKFEYEKGGISAQTDANGTRMNFSLTINQQDSIHAEVRLPDYTSLSSIDLNEKIEGSVTGTYRDMDIVTLFVTSLQNLKGVAKFDLKLDGTLGSPRVTGGMSMANASATIPELGVRLQDISLAIVSQGSNQLRIQGGASSGDGKVNIDGEVSLDAATGWPARVSVKGNNFEIAKRPGLWIVASPDLELNMKDREINIQGKVAIPRTKIELNDLPEAAITPSRDVVIVREENEAPPAKAKAWTVLTEVQILPGDNVRFEGFGLSGRVKGNLTVSKTLGKPFVGTGVLEIVEGEYRALGANLNIQQGQLIFAGNPLDNPAIDIRAVRASLPSDVNIVVGLRAQGRLKSATITLFSEPPMEETDILSYLLLGRPAADRGDTDADLLVAAAAAIGTTEAYTAAQQLAQSLGFEDVRVNRSGLVLGRSLSPRLYLSYEIGLLQPQNTLQLRYRLSDLWAVKVESSEHQSADLIYTIER